MFTQLKTREDLPSGGPFEWVQDGVPVGPEVCSKEATQLLEDMAETKNT